MSDTLIVPTTEMTFAETCYNALTVLAVNEWTYWLETALLHIT